MNVSDLFAGILYAIVGGVATRSYMPERATKDVDILVPAQSYAVSVERLRAAGWEIERELRFFDSSLGLRGTLWKFSSVQIDLITSDQPWAVEACQAPLLDVAGVRVIALPYLVLMKLDAGRPQDTADITRMLALATDADLLRTRDVVRRFARDSETIDDFESLLEIGRWQLENDSESAAEPNVDSTDRQT